MILPDSSLSPATLRPVCEAVFAAAGPKILRLRKRWDPARGAPVFTAAGEYTTRGWTEWTQGFQIGAALLVYDATGDAQFLEAGREDTLARMTPHLTHTGVHDHGFNNISTYGNLLRLMSEGRAPENAWERRYYELALKVSGSVQAGRWTALGPEAGYVYSFNGPHSLFADTIRSLRSLAVAWSLGHTLKGEGDRPVSLLGRALQHAESTAKYNMLYGTGRDIHDIRGRVAHEAIFNLNDGAFRCLSTQQGHSPFSTWTRGQAWVLCGFAEQLEFLTSLPEDALEPHGGKERWLSLFRETARAAADLYLSATPADGVPYWDTGAPGLAHLGNWRDRAAEPDNDHEPVDSSAACIAAQGLLRLGKLLAAPAYTAAGLTTARTVLQEPYLSPGPEHEGLILHSIYHRPNGWDYVPPGSRIPKGESSQWGDYHALELALWILREADGGPYLKFFQ